MEREKPFVILAQELHFKNTWQPEKFQNFIEKIIQLGPEDRPKFL